MFDASASYITKVLFPYVMISKVFPDKALFAVTNVSLSHVEYS